MYLRGAIHRLLIKRFHDGSNGAGHLTAEETIELAMVLLVQPLH